MIKQILWTACVTPFSEDSAKIDYISIKRCLQLQAQSGNGIILFGSTGENLSLTKDEKKEILRVACNLELPSIVVGVPSHNLYEALEWIEFTKGFPIHGYMMTTPIYTKPGIKGQIEWFEKLLNTVQLPAILYNIPSRAGVCLYPETVQHLQYHERFCAIKDSSGTIQNIAEYKMAAPKIAVYCGDDHMMPAMAAEGSIGLISVASNAWPEATRRYVQHTLAGGKITPPSIWWQISKALFAASNPIPIKALMRDIGLIQSDSVRSPLNIADLPTRQTLLEYHTIIANYRPA